MIYRQWRSQEGWARGGMGVACLNVVGKAGLKGGVVG